MESADRAKSELRTTMRRRLADIEKKDARAAARAVTERALAHRDVADASTLLVCHSFGDELDTRLLIDRLRDLGKRICLPRCVEGTRKLTVHLYPCALETLPFGLEQPTRTSPTLDPASLDLALLVGLAFDRDGYRLGHGGGYFDRFLATSGIPALGLAYDLQIVERLPRLGHDIAMRALVTESRTLEPGAEGP